MLSPKLDFCSNRNKLGKCDNHRIEQELIEKFVVDSLINRILNGKTIDVILNNIKIEYENLKDSTQTDDIKRRLKDIQKECDNIVDNIAKTGSDRLIARLEMLENTEKDLQEQLEFLSNSNINIDANKITEILSKDISKLKNGSKEELKILVQKYIKKIIINNDNFEIEYTFTDIIDSRNFVDDRTVATIQIYELYHILKKRG